MGDRKASAGFSTCKEGYGVCVCDLISGRERHTAQKEWYAERETGMHTETEMHTERQTDRHIHACRERGEERDRGKENTRHPYSTSGSLYVDGHGTIETLSKVYGDTWVSHQIYI